MPWSSANTKIQRALSMLDDTEKQNGGLLTFAGTAIPVTAPPQAGVIAFDDSGRVLGYRGTTWQPGIGQKHTITISGASTSGTTTVLKTISEAPNAYALLTIEKTTAGALSKSANYRLTTATVFSDTVTVTLDAAPGVGESVNVHIVFY